MEIRDPPLHDSQSARSVTVTSAAGRRRRPDGGSRYVTGGVGPRLDARDSAVEGACVIWRGEVCSCESGVNWPKDVWLSRRRNNHERHPALSEMDLLEHHAAARSGAGQ